MIQDDPILKRDFHGFSLFPWSERGWSPATPFSFSLRGTEATLMEPLPKSASIEKMVIPNWIHWGIQHLPAWQLQLQTTGHCSVIFQYHHVLYYLVFKTKQDQPFSTNMGTTSKLHPISTQEEGQEGLRFGRPDVWWESQAIGGIGHEVDMAIWVKPIVWWVYHGESLIIKLSYTATCGHSAANDFWWFPRIGGTPGSSILE